MSMPTNFAPSLSAPDMLAAPELGLDGVVRKHNAVVNKVGHVVETLFSSSLFSYPPFKASVCGV